MLAGGGTDASVVKCEEQCERAKLLSACGCYLSLNDDDLLTVAQLCRLLF